jgi:cyclophilin family peptidyl-prolyl cis-trans isomerase
MKKQIMALLLLSSFIIINFSGCVDVGELTDFSITTFSVEPSIINEGDTANISWVVMSAQTVTIDNGVGNVSNIGNRIINPIETTTYTITAKNGTKTLTATTQIIVRKNNESNENNDEADNSDTNESEEQNDNPIAVFSTSKGIFKIELYEDKAPQTCENFIRLVNDGFYDGMIFHRIMDDFMIQAGNTLQYGTLKNSPYGNIIFESYPELLHEDGSISMASTGWGVGGSAQFFICDGPQSSLDGGYAVFGKTIEGIEVVHDIADEPHDNSSPAGGGVPYTDIVINSITIE